MTAKEIIEALPGATEAELDEIIGIIRTAKKRTKSRDEFEREANPLLVPYRIEIARNHPSLLGHSGAALKGGQIVLSHWGSWPQLRMLLSHELVHQHQIDRANAEGKSEEMYQSAHNKMMPGGVLDRAAYYEDPHELMAHGRTYADNAKAAGKDYALSVLRRTAITTLSNRARKRFLKRAYQYTVELPEGRDDVASLPIPVEAKAYSRRHGLAVMKRQPQSFIDTAAAVTSQKARQHGFKNKDGGQKAKLVARRLLDEQ